MSVVFYTSVLWSGPSPLGLLPGRWLVRHKCSRCRETVSGDALIAHAQSHDGDVDDDDA